MQIPNFSAANPILGTCSRMLNLSDAIPGELAYDNRTVAVKHVPAPTDMYEHHDCLP